MQRNELSLIAGILLVFCLLNVQVFAALNLQKMFSCTGVITAINLGVFSDEACAFPLARVDWGNVTPGMVYPTLFFVKNTGNVPEILSFSYDDWTPPEAVNAFWLSWNATDVILQPQASIAASLVLSVAWDTGTLQNFTCTVTITGTQH